MVKFDTTPTFAPKSPNTADSTALAKTFTGGVRAADSASETVMGTNAVSIKTIWVIITNPDLFTNVYTVLVIVIRIAVIRFIDWLVLVIVTFATCS